MAPAVPVIRDRVDVLDAVRGAAVLGILFVNIESLSGYTFLSHVERASLPLAEWNGAAEAMVAIFVEGKFYALFSLLFGIGFAVFVQRAQARGADAVPLFRRRLTGLLLIGLAHTLLIWFGDILVTYAVLGFGLIPFLRKDDRMLLRWAVALLLPAVLYALAAGAALFVTPPVARGPDGALPPVLANAVEHYRTGSYRQVVEANVVMTIANALRRLSLMFFPRVFAMFLIGLYVGRLGMLTNVEGYALRLRRIALWGALAGLPLSIVGAVVPDRLPNAAALLVEGVAKSFAIPALTLSYAAGLCLLFRQSASLMRAFAAVGRMALSNYLLHSVAGVVLFYGIGFGLFGRVSLIVALVLAVAFFAVQIVASEVWLSRAAFGPAEWVWRTFTYGRRFPLFKAAVSR
jgi:uncharacterized protein